MTTRRFPALSTAVARSVIGTLRAVLSLAFALRVSLIRTAVLRFAARLIVRRPMVSERR